HTVGRGAEVDFVAQIVRCFRRLGCAGLRLLADLADEADALARNRADEALLLAAVADRLARRVDSAGERRVRDDASAPHPRDEVVLADHAVAVLQEINQEVEDLRLQRHQRVGPPQLPAVYVKYLIRKEKLQVVAPQAQMALSQ